MGGCQVEGHTEKGVTCTYPHDDVLLQENLSFYDWSNGHWGGASGAQPSERQPLCQCWSKSIEHPAQVKSFLRLDYLDQKVGQQVKCATHCQPRSIPSKSSHCQARILRSRAWHGFCKKSVGWWSRTSSEVFRKSTTFLVLTTTSTAPCREWGLVSEKRREWKEEMMLC